MILSRVYVMEFEVCQECFMLLPVFYCPCLCNEV